MPNKRTPPPPTIAGEEEEEVAEQENGNDTPVAKKTKKATRKVEDSWYKRESLSRREDSGANTLKIMTWNVAGLRPPTRLPALKALVEKYGPEVICLQETKLQDIHEKDFEHCLDGYDAYFTSSTAKKGYSGVAMFVKKGEKSEEIDKKSAQKTLTSFFKGNKSKSKNDDSAPSSFKNLSVVNALEVKRVIRDIDDPMHKGECRNIFKHEGRIITIEFEKFYLTGVYVPNSGAKLERLSFRVEEWGPYITGYLKKLNDTKPVIYTGDLNVSHLDFDIWNIQGNPKVYAGITPEERASFGEMLSQGFVDAFRHFHPDAKGQFTWWSQRTNGRPFNKGLRLDYFVCSQDLTEGNGLEINDCYILHDECEGVSDHCPVVLTLKI